MLEAEGGRRGEGIEGGPQRLLPPVQILGV